MLKKYSQKLWVFWVLFTNDSAGSLLACMFLHSIIFFQVQHKSWLRKYNVNVISKVNLNEEVILLSYNFWRAFLSPFFHEQDTTLTSLDWSYHWHCSTRLWGNPFPALFLIPQNALSKVVSAAVPCVTLEGSAHLLQVQLASSSLCCSHGRRFELVPQWEKWLTVNSVASWDTCVRARGGLFFGISCEAGDGEEGLLTGTIETELLDCFRKYFL